MDLQQLSPAFLLPGVDPGVSARAAPSPARGTPVSQEISTQVPQRPFGVALTGSLPSEGPRSSGHARSAAGDQVFSSHPTQIAVKVKASRNRLAFTGLDAPGYRRFALGKSKGVPPAARPESTEYTLRPVSLVHQVLSS